MFAGKLWDPKVHSSRTRAAHLQPYHASGVIMAAGVKATHKKSEYHALVKMTLCVFLMSTYFPPPISL